MAEVSYAVEIDMDMLRDIETGATLPSEDILVLLLSHLQVEESTARKVFKLAGYDLGTQDQNDDHDQPKQQVFMFMPSNHVQYTDEVDIKTSKSGVVLSFFQPEVGEGKAPVSRIGMSREQAEQLVKDLQHELQIKSKPTVYKLLPAKISKPKKNA